MRIILLLSLISFISCALRPGRNIASVTPIVFAEIEAKECLVKMFPREVGRPNILQFYLELRNITKDLVDVELKEILVKDNKKILSGHIRRISKGRYEVEVRKSKFKALKFLVQNHSIKHQVVIYKNAVRKKSSIVILSDENYRMKARLILKDKNDAALEVQRDPEIIFMGLGSVTQPVMIETGVWEFDIEYPEENQIIYISARVNGVLLERLLRFQHVEK
jgi:hypothetical protein